MDLVLLLVLLILFFAVYHRLLYFCYSIDDSHSNRKYYDSTRKKRKNSNKSDDSTKQSNFKRETSNLKRHNSQEKCRNNQANKLEIRSPENSTKQPNTDVHNCSPKRNYAKPLSSIHDNHVKDNQELNQWHAKPLSTDERPIRSRYSLQQAENLLFRCHGEHKCDIMEPEKIIQHFKEKHPNLIFNQSYKTSYNPTKKSFKSFILKYEDYNFLADLNCDTLKIYHYVTSLQEIEMQSFEFYVTYSQKNNTAQEKIKNVQMKLQKRIPEPNKDDAIEFDIKFLKQKFDNSNNFNVKFEIKILCSSCNKPMDCPKNKTDDGKICCGRCLSKQYPK